MAKSEPDGIELRGNIVDVHARHIGSGRIVVQAGKIATVEIEAAEDVSLPYYMPGFVDAHIHIESSMLVPTEFARLATAHGTVGTVSDPHEIANVLGVPGVRFMLDNAAQTPLKIMFGAPPCVPATTFETAGACLTPEDVRMLLAEPRVGYLAEVMNYPGVIGGDADLLAKIEHAKAAGKTVDGHSPGLRGAGVKKYFGRGITTDHECFTLEEALEKLECDGVHILIREGSAAKNFEALHPLLRSHPARVMLCSDDKHPNDLEDGHINQLVLRALALGYDLFDILRAACVNPVHHYRMPVGLLRENDPADFIEIADLKTFRVLRTFIDGNLVAQNGKSLLPSVPVTPLNNFHATPKSPLQFAHTETSPRDPSIFNIIECYDGQLITGRQVGPLTPEMQKIIVLNRYAPHLAPAIGFIKGFNLQRGAIASSVAHDSHNIVAVGENPVDLAAAVNLVIAERGGLAAVDGERSEVLPLPVAGILTHRDGYETAAAYRRIDAFARSLSSNPLTAPFMTLSFMALLVIPSLKLSDKGLFDVDQFRFVPLAGN